jgi:transposase InsO family protein
MCRSHDVTAFSAPTGVGSGAQHDPTQELGEHLVDQPHRHSRIMRGHLSRTNRQVTGCVRSFGHPRRRRRRASHARLVHWHNTRRLHSYLDDLPPAEYEQQFYAAHPADQITVGRP